VTGPLRVGLVEDQRMFADALRLLLETEPGIEVAWVAPDAAEAERRLGDDPPDVVLTDVDLPGLDGISATRRIAADHPTVKVLVMTARSDAELVARAIEAGACGLVTKHGAAGELPEILRTAASGALVLPPTETGELVRRLRDRVGGAVAPGALSKREREVLQGLTDGLSTVELAERLLVSPRTVQGHVQSILTKLGVRSKLEAVLCGLRAGIVRLRIPDLEGDRPAAT
jgi:DNA-binding NarL/FixJ family response regulator